MASLDPDAVLQRGYVRVTGVDGRTVCEASAARNEQALSLKFRDGTVEVSPLSGIQRRPRSVAPAKRPVAPSRQDDLFG